MPIDETTLRKYKRIGDELLDLQFEGRFLALVLAIRAFTVNQPRVPAGNPDGGQWVADGGHIIRVADNEPPPQYTVDLQEEDKLGGHAYRDHVGKSDTELLLRIVNTQSLKVLSKGYGAASGSFVSRDSANDLVNQVLREYKPEVDRVTAGEAPGATLNKRFGYPTGKEAAWLSLSETPFIRKTYEVRVIIRYAPGSSRGYRVLTAFPFNIDRIN